MTTQFLTIAAAMAFSTARVFAGPIGTFLFAGTATGTLNGTPFTSESLVLTYTAAISNVVGCNTGDCFLTGGTASFTLGGSIFGTFAESGVLSDNQTYLGGVVEFDNPSPLVAVSDNDIGGTALATYDFQSSIGPLGFDNGNLSTSDWVNQGTSQGSFTVTDFTDVSFQGIVASASVPEPATLVFTALGLLGLFSLRQLLKTPARRG
jgi:hypothetical protein